MLVVPQRRGCMGEARFELLERRDFHSVAGIRWRVQEALAFDIPGASGPSCLIFDSETACHRLWTYPADWAALTIPALLALGERRR
jgi:hypothetical protein